MKDEKTKVKKVVKAPANTKKAEVKTTPKAKKAEVVEAKVTVVEKKASASVSVDVLGVDGKAKGKMSLPGEIFGAKVNPILMAQAVRVYLANQRAGSASTKTRGEVRGSTRKIYRQKGTGRARHGGIRAPIFVGGGIAFGPRPRDHSLKLSEKMRRRALFSALTLKLNDKKVIIADSLDNAADKTSKMNSIMKAFNLTNKKGKGDNVLFVLPSKNEAVERVTRNISGITLEKAQNLNTYEVLNSKYILFMKDAIEVLSKTFVKS